MTKVVRGMIAIMIPARPLSICCCPELIRKKGRALPTEKLLELLDGVTEPVLANQLGLLFDAGYVTRSEDGSWLLCRDMDSVSLLSLYQAGEFYLPVGEEPEIPTTSEWDEAFFRSVSGGELNMHQSLKEMYTQSTH